jgi:hypothetical protein
MQKPHKRQREQTGQLLFDIGVLLLRELRSSRFINHAQIEKAPAEGIRRYSQLLCDFSEMVSVVQACLVNQRIKRSPRHE